ncbi:porin, partial [Escherichia coli]
SLWHLCCSEVSISPLFRWPNSVNHFSTWYYFNKNMNVYTAYQINLLDKSDYVLAHGLNTDDQLAFGIVYQF